MHKALLLGNEAVARGLWQAGCRLVSSYPGTPSTEITEYAATYPELHAEWAPNEKVALETAHGACIAGARSFCAQKHVGLNVAADPLFTASYTGVGAGFVVAVADDPGMHSSQNEQDSRHYARAAKLLMLEPADAQECLDFTQKAFALSEQFDSPVLLRLSTRVAHSRALAQLGERQDLPLLGYTKNPGKYVMMPAMAKARHHVVEARIAAQRHWTEQTPLNHMELGSTRMGVIAAGSCYQYAKEALGSNASYFKLGCLFPLPEQSLKDFCAHCETVFVIEELDDYIEQHCKALGLAVHGKDVFAREGEFCQNTVRQAILGAAPQGTALPEPLPPRPPVLCPGCPHRGLFLALQPLAEFVSGDIGCYTLSALPPLGALDTCVCMGASISGLHGRNLVRPHESSSAVAVLGDSTFIHSGITGLVQAVYNQSNTTVVVLDNSITGMTGHQQNPTTGRTLKGDATAAVNLEALCRAVGVQHVAVCDPYNLTESAQALRAALDYEGVAVVIARRPCALLKTVQPQPPLCVTNCKGCKACLRAGCPAVTLQNKHAVIDKTQCNGCGVCAQLCKFAAIAPCKSQKGTL